MNGKRKTKGDRIFDIVISIVSALIIIAVAYPLYFIIIASFSQPDAVQNGRVLLYPVDCTLDAYRAVFSNNDVWIGYRNTIFYTVSSTFLSLLFTLPAAYALSRKDFPFAKGLSIFFLIAMYFNGGMVPTYMIINKLGLLNTVWVMIIPTCVNVFHLVIARTFFSNTIHPSLLEAAQLEGCSDFHFFMQIVLPLSKAIIAVIALYTAVGVWNSYMSAMLYITDQDKYPLQIVLRKILLDQTNEGGNAMETLRKAELLKYGLIIVSTLPIMCAYPFIQKYFTQGVMLGSVKG